MAPLAPMYPPPNVNRVRVNVLPPPERRPERAVPAVPTPDVAHLRLFAARGSSDGAIQKIRVKSPNATM